MSNGYFSGVGAFKQESKYPENAGEMTGLGAKKSPKTKLPKKEAKEVKEVKEVKQAKETKEVAASKPVDTHPESKPTEPSKLSTSDVDNLMNSVKENSIENKSAKS